MVLKSIRLKLTLVVYIFIGSVIVGERWFRIVPGTIVGVIGVGYAALEFIPSIEPPANMRYDGPDALSET